MSVTQPEQSGRGTDTSSMMLEDVEAALLADALRRLAKAGHKLHLASKRQRRYGVDDDVYGKQQALCACVCDIAEKMPQGINLRHLLCEKRV